MKNGLIALFILMGSLCVFAQNERITVRFEYPEDDYVLYLNRFLNIGMIKTEIIGDSLANKCYDIDLVVCRNGEFEKVNLTENINFISSSDTISFYFISQPLSQDKVKMEFYGSLGHKEEIEIDTRNALLIEPENNAGYSYEENIPIMTFSPGIIQELEINGKVLQGMDVCGIRYSEIQPSQWHDKFGIKNYLYFELVPKIKR